MRNIYPPNGSKGISLLLPAGAVSFLFLFFILFSCLFSVPPHLFSASPLRFDSLPCASEIYTWQVRFRPSRRKRPPDCWEDIFRRCPRSPSVSSFSVLHRGRRGFLYGRQWIRSVGRVFRSSGVKTRIWEEGGRREYTSYTSASESSVEAMFSGDLSRNVARLSTTTIPAPVAQEYNFESRDTGVE